MKHQTPESMKFRKLMRRLGESRLVCVGTLELLWIATQKNAAQGDIGRFSNEEIAIECEWEGDPDHLVETLVATGWLDRCETHRLLVHDWSEHAPGWVTRQLKRHNKEFFSVNKESPSVTRDAPPAGQASSVTGSSLLSVTNDGLEATPNPTQPNPTQPNLNIKSETAVAEDPPESSSEDVKKVVESWNAEMSKNARLTSKRTKTIRTRLRDPWWRENWREALGRVRGSPFLSGDNDRGWSADLDFFLKPDTATNILEGKYDGKPKPTKGRGQVPGGREYASESW